MSDELGITAQGLPTLERQNKKSDFDRLARLAVEHGVRCWLMGLPRHMSGEEGTQAAKARAFGAELGQRTGLPVAYWDERLTTVEAGRVLREAGTSREKTRAAIDRLSAVILLQSYLDAGGDLA